MIVLLLLPLSVVTYVGWHLWCLLPPGWVWKTLVTAVMLSVLLLMFASVTRYIDRWPLPLAVAGYEVGTSSVIVLLYLLMLFLLLDIGRLVRLVPRSVLYHNGWTAGVIFVTMCVIFVWGNRHYHHKYRQFLPLSTQKTMAKPVRIVMVSDLHIGYHNRREELHRWVDMINGEQPDVILMAGDIIDGSMRPLTEERMHEEFRRLKAPVYACAGNHEYICGESSAKQFFERAGIHLLQDSCVTLGDLCIIGRDDRSNRGRAPLQTLMAKADREKYCIVMDHQPYRLEEAEEALADFQLSGHTHHGQVWPVSWITEQLYECAFGEHRRGGTRYYVSSGLGLWGGKFRIGTRSEYVVATVGGK